MVNEGYLKFYFDNGLWKLYLERNFIGSFFFCNFWNMIVLIVGVFK